MISESFFLASMALLALGMVTAAMLKAWQGWLTLKARELDVQGRSQPDGGHASGMARIEIADLKERIRKLEAIAAGVDL